MRAHLHAGEALQEQRRPEPPQDGLVAHFTAIANSTGLPCILYNVPSRTSLNMDVGTTLRLAELPN
ncbi:MAG: dihydrodipicolinate synthase family protein, partial [Planctomycetota bacterium]